MALTSELEQAKVHIQRLEDTASANLARIQQVENQNAYLTTLENESRANYAAAVAEQESREVFEIQRREDEEQLKADRIKFAMERAEFEMASGGPSRRLDAGILCLRLSNILARSSVYANDSFIEAIEVAVANHRLELSQVNRSERGIELEY